MESVLTAPSCGHVNPGPIEIKPSRLIQLEL